MSMRDGTRIRLAAGAGIRVLDTPGFLRTLGLVALSLWRVELRSWCRLDVVPRKFRHVVTRISYLVCRPRMDGVDAAIRPANSGRLTLARKASPVELP